MCVFVKHVICSLYTHILTCRYPAVFIEVTKAGDCSNPVRSWDWVRSNFQIIGLPAELGDLADEARRIFAEIGRPGRPSSAGECSPPIDVFETDDSIEIRADLPDVDPAALRIVVKNHMVLIAGEKTPPRGRGDSSFHLVERGFGRFARTVQLTTTCDPTKARATLDGGELRLSFPKTPDRRGRVIRIPID